MGNIVRHADLSKLSDKILSLEAKALFDNIQLIHRKIGTSLVDRMNSIMPVVPTWKYVEDLQKTVERLECVLDEINYRRIP